MIELLGKSREELRRECQAMGEPAYRGDQIYRALYREKKFELTQMTNLPRAFREKLARAAAVTLPRVKHKYLSQDGSLRYLLEMKTPPPAGEKGSQDEHSAREPERAVSVEAVYMPSEGRQTICISTQAGCAVDCQFCLTAQLGLIRNLTASEILAQVLLPLAEAGSGRENQDPVQTNVVLMGQGEPLLNFDPVMAALEILLDPEGVGLSAKHVTLSTSGIVPGIEKLSRQPVRPKLAISLNASSDEQRDRLMPINRKYPLAKLMEACRNYPLRNWEHLTFEYVMLGGVNDSPEDARRVVRLLSPLTSVKVNLIPWNPGELPFAESREKTIEQFRRILVERGIPAFVRYSRGRDVMAACGQLALQEVRNNPLAVIA
jgi:23S rRNA (adenine2503-C2)-methyltransferase